MKINPIATYNNQNSPSAKGRIAKTKALEDYIRSLSESEAKSFLKNKQIMENVKDNNVYTFTLSAKWNDKQEGELLHARILKNGKTFIKKVFPDMHQYIHGDPDQAAAAEKFTNYMTSIMFDKLFAKYNPDLENDFELETTLAETTQDAIIDNCDNAEFNLGNVSQFKILVNNKDYKTIKKQRFFDTYYYVYDKSDNLVQKVEVTDDERNYQIVKDYKDGKLIREMGYLPDENEIRFARVLENGKIGKYRNVDKFGNIIDPYYE